VTALPLVGAAIGVTVFALIVLLRPPTVDPLVALARIDAAHRRPHLDNETRPAVRTGAEERVGGWVADQLRRHGVRYTTLRQDLTLTGQSFDATMGRKAALAVFGFLLGLVILAAGSSLGLALPAIGWLVAAVLLAGVFFVVPDVDARTAAHRRRAEFTRALGAYLDWVSLQMSGRAAAEQALPDAARIGDGWPLQLIRATVSHAARAGIDPWTALAQLGERIGVADLVELGTLIQLVVHDGAQVRDTLSARAASIRAEELADAEGTAGKRDQSMLLAQILLGIGFAVFVGYPAVTNFLRI
jgi:Flp pilus assembly protein TadB